MNDLILNSQLSHDTWARYLFNQRYTALAGPWLTSVHWLGHYLRKTDWIKWYNKILYQIYYISICYMWTIINIMTKYKVFMKYKHDPENI